MNPIHCLTTQRITKLLTQIIPAAIVLSVIVTSVAAEEPLTGTMKKVKDTGAITLAFRESAIPFSYL